MTKRSLYSNTLIVFGFGLFLLLVVDHYYFESTIVDGHFWAPIMVVEPLSVDFGDVSVDDDVRREIMIKNVGRSSLIIDRVMPSCGSCIIIHSYPKEPIPPGKQEKIVFSLDISKRQGDFKTSFIIISNAKPQEIAVVQVTANILSAGQ